MTKLGNVSLQTSCLIIVHKQQASGGTYFAFKGLVSDWLACLVGTVFHKHNASVFFVPSRQGQTSLKCLVI